MKLKIDNKNGVVDTAYYDVEFYYPGLVIHTVKKWVYPDALSSYTDRDNGEDVLEFLFWSGKDGEYDSVALIAETESEKEIVNGIPFLQHNKDQLWYMLVPYKREF